MKSGDTTIASAYEDVSHQSLHHGPLIIHQCFMLRLGPGIGAVSALGTKTDTAHFQTLRRFRGLIPELIRIPCSINVLEWLHQSVPFAASKGDLRILPMQL